MFRNLSIEGMGIRYQFGPGCGGGMLQDALRLTVIELVIEEKTQFILACGALFPWGFPTKPCGHMGIWPEINEMDPRFGDGYCRFFPLNTNIPILEKQTFDAVLCSDDAFLHRLKLIEASEDDGTWAEITIYLYGKSTRVLR